MALNIFCPEQRGGPWRVAVRDTRAGRGWVFGEQKFTMAAAIESALEANVPFNERPKLMDRDIRRLLG